MQTSVAGNAATHWPLIAEMHVVLHCVKKCMGESIAMVPQVWKIHY